MTRTKVYMLAAMLMAIAVTAYTLAIIDMQTLFPSLTDTEAMWTNASLVISPIALANIMAATFFAVLLHKYRRGEVPEFLRLPVRA